MGILTGINTVISDDPMLNCRFDESLCENPSSEYEILKKDGPNPALRNPFRIILDSKLSIPLDSKIVKTATEIETIVVTSNDSFIRVNQQEKIRR